MNCWLVLVGEGKGRGRRAGWLGREGGSCGLVWDVGIEAKGGWLVGKVGRWIGKIVEIRYNDEGNNLILYSTEKSSRLGHERNLSSKQVIFFI